MNILLVEDDKLIITILKLVLQRKGHNITIAENGEEGLNKFKEINPDLVILDIMLPKMNGLDCLKEIKEFNKNANVIMCSCVMDGGKIDQAISLGALDYIIKPFTDEDLTKKLQEIESKL